MGIGCASKMADSSPAKMKSEQQLGDVSSILQKLKDEVAYLQDEVEAKGAGFYVPLANQLNATRAAMGELTCTLDSCNGGLRSKDADMIPAAVGGAGAVDGEADFGKSIRLIQKSASGARAAYQYASVSAKGLVEDADKLDIVVKACQTEYIKLKLLNNNAKAYVNAKRLKWQTQADCFRYWAEFVHSDYWCNPARNGGSCQRPEVHHGTPGGGVREGSRCIRRSDVWPEAHQVHDAAEEDEKLQGSGCFRLMV